MKIDNIKLKSPKNPNIFLVAVGEKEFILHSDMIVKFKLSTHEEIDEASFFDAVDESEYTMCLNKAIEYISNKLKTTKQLKDYLYKKGYKTQTINKVIDKLGEYSILNDENFALAFIDFNKGRLSKKVLKLKLQEKGVKKDLAENLFEDFDDYELCKKMAEKFLKNKEITKENTEKLIRHLQYKGFNWEDISKTLNNLKIDEEQ